MQENNEPRAPHSEYNGNSPLLIGKTDEIIDEFSSLLFGPQGEQYFLEEYPKLKSSLLSIANQVIEKPIRESSPTLNLILDNYPCWNSLPLLISARTMEGIYKTAVETVGANSQDNALEIIKDILTKKQINSLALSATFTQEEPWEAHPLRSEITTLFGILQADLLDGIGDFQESNLRNPQDSDILYAYPYHAFRDEEIPKLGTLSRLQEIQPFLREMYINARNLLNTILAPLDPKVKDQLREAGSKSIKDYGECLKIIHIQQDDVRKEYAQQYYEECKQNGTKVEPLFDNPYFWFNTKGTYFLPIALINEAILNPNLTDEEVDTLCQYYDQVIPFIHLLCDDLCDWREDQTKKEGNVFNEITKGRLDDVFNRLSGYYGIAFKANHPERNIQLLLDLLTRLYTEKKYKLLQNPGNLHVNMHIKLVEDVVRFYYLEVVNKNQGEKTFEGDMLAKLLSDIAET